MDDVFLSNPPSPESDHSSKPSCSENTVHLKLLIPSGAAGAIIGKDGRAITSIQQQTSTKVKVSKQNEFFPGTTERVCLITGSVAGVLQVHQHIARQIIDKKDLVNGQTNTLVQQRQTQYPFQSSNGLMGSNLVNVDRTRQVKVLVPNSTAGMIIGKGGSYIRQLQQSSGTTIQISQRAATPLSTAERCVTITGELEGCQRALEAVISKLSEDPQAINIATFTNISYNGNTPLLTTPLTNAAARTQGAGAPVMPLMSPASVSNFLLPALWNTNLLPYVLPRSMAADNRAQGDLHQPNHNNLSNCHPSVSTTSAYHPHSATLLHLSANGGTNANPTFSAGGLLTTPSAAMLQQLWALTAAANSCGGGANGAVTGATVAGGGVPVNSMEAACAMKELQVPESFIPVLTDNLSSLQNECGVSINLHAPHSKPIGTQLPMKLSAIPLGTSHRHEPERWRLVSVFGSPSALFRSVDRIQALQQQHQSKSSPPTTSFSMVSGGLTTKSAAAAKPISANLSAM